MKQRDFGAMLDEGLSVVSARSVGGRDPLRVVHDYWRGCCKRDRNIIAARFLTDAGLTAQQIGDRLGVHKLTVKRYRRDWAVVQKRIRRAAKPKTDTP